jgi:hypothetical protein
LPHHQERQCQPAVTAPRSGATRSAPALPGYTRRGPEPRPGPRGAASLWGLFPAGPSSSTLAPSPLEGRVCGSCPEPGTGKRPGSSAELTTFGWTLWSPSGPARPAQPSRARRPPRPCSAHRPPATSVSGSSLAAASAWATALPAVQSARAAQPQAASKRDPSPTQNPRLAVPRWGHGARMRWQRSTCRPHRPGSATRIGLRTHRQGESAAAAPPGWRSPSWPGDLVRAGHGR